MARWLRHRDPHASREARKYDRPIPSREHIMALLTAVGMPLPFEDVVQRLGLDDARDQDSLRKRLRAMERDGQLIRNRRGGYGVLEKMDLVRGRVVGHGDGFGFLVPDAGGEDLFLAPKEMRSLLHGDRIVARPAGIDRRGRREAALVEVLERNTERVVGRFFREREFGFVDPDNRRIHQDVLIPPGGMGGAREGQIVVAELTEQPTRYAQPVGRVVEVLGDHMAPGMEIDIAIRAHELPDGWPEAVEREVAGLGEEVPESAKQGRVDLRALPLLTIDGADARDFDDAVYCERRPKGWKLMVAIADVSAYVMPGTALDADARLRGNSVYFPDRVIPMLPEVLSNGLCSLNPLVDRLCMVCELSISEDGQIKRSRFFEGLMRSHARLTYDEVAAVVVERDGKRRKKLGALVPHLDELYRLYRALRLERERRGAIDLDTTETRIIFGPEKKIERVEPLVRNDAHKIIEECMIRANVAAARFLARHKLPLPYRVHDGPTKEKLGDLRQFLAELGLRLGGGNKPEPGHYAALLKRVSKRLDNHLIQTVLLRSLSQAVYTPENTGHFGLGLDAYTHFTSPIRRYPDLVVHRAIRHVLMGAKPQEFALNAEGMTLLGQHCSMTERRADEATRDAVDWLKCEFMLDKVGDVFPGIISAVTSFGLFVELRDIYVEGLVHVTALGHDYFHFDAAHHRLQGERSGVIYRLADSVTVRVMRVDLDRRRIDFELADAPPDSRRRTGRRTSMRRRKRG